MARRLDVSSRISVVVISRNEGEELRRTVENLEDTLPDAGEIVVVDDGSIDASARSLDRRRGRVRLHRVKGFGVARARNHGARLSRGNVIVFADAHIRLDPFWWRALAELLRDPRVGAAAPAITGFGGVKMMGYGLTFRGPTLDVQWFRRKPKVPGPAPILPGCCFAMRRDVFEVTGGWDEGQLQRGNVDNEGCVRFWLAGYDLIVTPETVVAHLFRKRSPYPVGWPQYLYNRLRLAFVNLSAGRIGKVVGSLRNQPGFGQAMTLLVDGDITARRREIISRQVRNDDWYFERFGLNW